MAADITELDAHEQPSEELRTVWKEYSRTEQNKLINGDIIDDLLVTEKATEWCTAGAISSEQLASAFNGLAGDGCNFPVEQDVPIYCHPILPGLLIIPSLVPPEIQKILLDRLVHRDLSVPHHQTNFHLHYDLPYPKDETGKSLSFFSLPPDSSIQFEPRDPTVNKTLSMRQVMERRLHWVTLGGQYDWSNRVYPGERPPEFPPDISRFLETLFPDTQAQAAIVNFYTPGDTMMMHRDVSEETNKGLVSLSFGCDCLFMISPDEIKEGAKMADEQGQAASQDNEKKKPYLLLRLRSGDAIYMTEESRYAWHGVPKVLKGTCPDWLEDWPAEDGKYEEWRGWMKNKRINLNVRQMRD